MLNKNKTSIWSIFRLPFVLTWCVLILAGWTLRQAWAFYRTRVGAVTVLVVCGAVMSSLLVTGAGIYDRSLEAQVEASLVSEIDKHASFKRDFERPRASTTPHEFMEVGGPTWIRVAGIRAIIVEARKAGLDSAETAVLLAIADRESGFNPLAKAKSTSACGLFQFIPETGERYGLPVSKCMNPRANARAEIKHFKRVLSKIRGKLYGLEEAELLVMMFRETYCKHHDGENSSGCSTTASAVVAKGLDVLFASQKELQTAEEMKRSSPGFGREVMIVMREAYATAKNIIEPSVARVAQTQWFTSRPKEAGRQ